jgi:hypothetical protein
MKNQLAIVIKAHFFLISIAPCLICSIYVNTIQAQGTCTGYDTTFIKHDTTWATRPTYFHGGIIFIEDGKSLTLGDGINVLELQFQLHCGIANSDTPKTASFLIIKPEVKLYPCGGVTSSGSWAGIRMTGVPDGNGKYTEYAYNTSTNSITGINSSQSSVKITNAIIQNADTGVICRNHAIIQLNSTQITNCLWGAAIIDSFPESHYATILTAPSPPTCESYINSCTFNIQNTVHVLSDSLKDYKCIYLYSTQYFEILGNTLECSETTAKYSFGRPTGIQANNANFGCHSTTGTLDPVTGCITYSLSTKVQNLFQNLSYGLYFKATNSSSTFALDDCKFQDCIFPLYANGGIHHIIHGNNFSLTTSGSSYWNSIADSMFNNFVWLKHAPNFIFYDNKLSEDKRHTTFFI